MGVFKRLVIAVVNGNYSIDRILKILAVAALALFIICSVSWLVQRPNRYQLMTGGITGLLRIDTCTGEIEYLMPDLKPYKIGAEEKTFTTEELFGSKGPSPKKNTIVGKIKRFLGIGSSPEIIPKGDLRLLPDQPKPKADEILGIKPKATDPNKIVDPYEEKTTTDFTPVAPVEKK